MKKTHLGSASNPEKLNKTLPIAKNLKETKKALQFKLILNPNIILKEGYNKYDRKIFRGLKSENKVVPLGDQYQKIIQKANLNMKCK